MWLKNVCNDIQVTLKKIGLFRILIDFLRVSIMFVFFFVFFFWGGGGMGKGEEYTFSSEHGPHCVIFIYSV